MAVSKKVADAYKNSFGADIMGETVDAPILPSAPVTNPDIKVPSFSDIKKSAYAPSAPVTNPDIKVPSFSDIKKSAYAPSGSAEYSPTKGVGYDYTKQSKLLSDTELQDAIRKQDIKDSGAYSPSPSEPMKALNTELSSRNAEKQRIKDQTDMLQRKINFQARQKNLGVSALDEAASYVGTDKFTDITGVNYKNPLFYLAKIADMHVTAAKALGQGAISAVGNLGSAIDLNAGDNIVGDFGESVADYAKVIKQKFPQLNPAKNIGKWEDPEFYVKGVSDMVPNLLGGMASTAIGAAVGGAATLNPLGAVVGGVAGAVGFGYAMESGNIYEDLLSRGYGPSSAEGWSKAYGAIASLPDAFFHVRGITGAVVHPLMQEVIKKGAAAEMKQTLFSTVKNFGKEAIKRTKGGGIEATTEGLQQFTQNVITSFYDKNQKLFDGVPESFIFGGLSGGGVEMVQNMTNGDIKKEIVLATQNEKAVNEAVKAAEILQQSYPEDKDISDLVLKTREELQNVTVQKQVLEHQYTEGTKENVIDTPEFQMTVGETVDGKYVSSATLTLESTSEVLNDPTVYTTREEAQLGTVELIQGYLSSKVTASENISETELNQIATINTSLKDLVTRPNPVKMITENRDVMLLARDSKDFSTFEKAVLKNNLLPENSDIQRFYDESKTKGADFITKREASKIVDKYASNIGVTTKFIEDIASPAGKKRLGSFLRDERVIKIVTKGGKDIEVTTPYHEVGHAYFQKVLTTEEQANVLNEVKSNSTKELTDSQAEEILVEDLRAYNDNKQLADLKKRISSPYKKALDSIVNTVKKLLKWFGKNSDSSVSKFYEDVLSMKTPSEKVEYVEKPESMDAVRNEYYRDPKSLTSKFFNHKEIAGKLEVSYNNIVNALKGAPLKENEKALISNVLTTYFAGQSKVTISTFEDAVISELLPLSIENSLQYNDYGADKVEMMGGDVIDHVTHIYNSPVEHGIKGHFTSPNLFGHTRVWETNDSNYIAEIQSDLFQKTRNDKEKREQIIKDRDVEIARIKSVLSFLKSNKSDSQEVLKEKIESDETLLPYLRRYIYGDGRPWVDHAIQVNEYNLSEILDRVTPATLEDQEPVLFAYKNIWHERMLKEEIRFAAQNGKESLLIPTPRTIAFIEGYISQDGGMPYTLPEGASREADLVPGDTIDMDGVSFTVIDAGSYSIDVAPTSEMVIFDYNQAWDEEANMVANDAIDEAKNLNTGIVIESGTVQYGDELVKFMEENSITDVSDVDVDDFGIWLRENGHVNPSDKFDDIYARWHEEGGTVYAVSEGGSVEEFQQPSGYDVSDTLENEFQTSDFEGAQKAVLDFYGRKVNPYFEKLRAGNVEKITDENGFAWLKTKILPEDMGAVEAFRTEEDFRDQHNAPSAEYGDVQDKMYNGGDFSLLEVAQGFHNQPSDYFDLKVGARYYSYDNSFGKESATAIRNVTNAVNNGESNITITAYRALPTSVDVKVLINRDWITFSKEYAVMHGEARFGEGEYSIIEQEVPIENVWWDGNDINEWGYDATTKEEYDNGSNESFRESTDNESATGDWLTQDMIDEKKSNEVSFKDALYEISIELELAEAGKRYTAGEYSIRGDSGGWTGYKSTFPQWIPSYLRNRTMLNKALQYIDTKLTFPPARMPRVRELVMEIYRAAANRAKDPATFAQIEKAMEKKIKKTKAAPKERLTYKKFPVPISEADLAKVQDILDRSADHTEVYSTKDAQKNIKFLRDAYKTERELLSRTGSPLPSEVTTALNDVAEYTQAGIEDLIQEKSSENIPSSDAEIMGLMAMVPKEILVNSKTFDDMLFELSKVDEDLSTTLSKMDILEGEKYMAAVKDAPLIEKLGAASETLQKTVEKNTVKNQAIIDRLTAARIKMIQTEEIKAQRETERNAVRNVARMVNLVDHKRMRMLENEVKTTDRQYVKDIIQAQVKAANAASIETSRIIKEKLREKAKYKNLLTSFEGLRTKVKKATKTGNVYHVDFARELLEIFDQYDLSSISDNTLTKLADVYDKMFQNEFISDELKEWYAKTIPRVTQKSVRDMSFSELQSLYDSLSVLAEKGKVQLELVRFMNEEEKQRQIDLAIDSTKNMDGPAEEGRRRDAVAASATKMAFRGIASEILSPISFADRIDGDNNYNGVNASYVKLIEKAEQKYYKEYHGAIDELRARVREVKESFTEEEETYLSLMARVREKADGAVKNIMEYMGVDSIPEQVGSLTMDEADQVIDIIQDISEKYNISNALKAIYEAKNNKPFPKNADYVAPLKYKKGTIDQTENPDLEVLAQYENGSVNIGDKFAIKRKKNVKLDVRIDLLQLVSEGWGHAFYYVNMQPTIDNIYQVVSSKQYTDHAGEIVSGWWKDYLTVVAQKGRGSKGSRFDPLIRGLRQNFQKAILGFKVSTALIQPSSAFNAAMVANVKWGADVSEAIIRYSALSLAIPSYTKGAISESDALLIRSGSGGSWDLYETNNLISTGFRNKKGMLQKAGAAYDKAGMWLIQKVDISMASGVYLGVKNALLRRGVSEEKAKSEAESFMLLSQSSTQIADRPLVLSRWGEVGRLAFTFQTFSLGLWAMISQAIIRNGIIKGTPTVKLKAALALLAIPFFQAFSSELIKTVSSAIKGKDDDDTLEDKFMNALNNTWVELVGTVPFFGRIIRGSVLWNKGYDIAGVSSFENAVSGVRGIVGGVEDVLSTGDYDSLINGLMQTAEAGATLAGISGTMQGFDILEGLMVTNKENKKIQVKKATESYLQNGEKNIDKYVTQVVTQLYTPEEIRVMKPQTKTAIENQILEAVVMKGNNHDAKLIAKMTKNEDKVHMLKGLKQQLPYGDFKNLVEYLKKYKLLSEEAELLIYTK